jgi:hypothetical protein
LRIVHLADLHLGYRQYQRLTPGGINQREADVARTFVRAIDAVIDLAPDVVLLAGDIFHVVRPTNPAILQAFIQFSRLMQELPNAEVVMIAGNHDTPRTAETGCILQLFSRIGIAVVDQQAQRLSYPHRDLSILAVPDSHAERPSLVPDPDFTHNILHLHGEIVGMMPEVVANMDRAAVAIAPDELGAHRWSYVALGHHHVYREVAPNAFYAGAIDYTSVNTWGEQYEQEQRGVPSKGFIERDLTTGRHRFHELPPSRPLIDLTPIWARGLTIEEINRAIRHMVESCDEGIDDRIVRLRVYDVPRHLAREIDHRAIRDFKRRALHFHLDIRRPEDSRPASVTGAPRRRLHELVRDHLTSRVIDAEIDRDALIALGLEYLDRAELAAAHSAGDE